MRTAACFLLVCSVLAGATRGDDAVVLSPLDSLYKDCLLYDKVDYAKLTARRADLEAYVRSLADLDVAAMTPDEQKATFINAFNAATLLLVVENHPAKLKSINDIPDDKRWLAKRWKIGGATYSLQQIEDDCLRAKFHDPRVLFAIN